MDNNQKVTVVTVAYNEEKHIRETCESIINQTFQDFEWIVIDGGSTDKTLEILNEYKNRINVLVSEKDTGVYNAMNKGIELATGDYINFLNGGDYYLDNDSLKKVAEFGFNKDIIYGDQRFLTDKDYFEKKYPDQIPHMWFLKDCIPHQSSFIKRALFDKYGKYNEKYKIVSDWEKWIILIDINKASYKHINTFISVHRYDGISSIYNKNHLDEREDVIKKHYGVKNLESSQNNSGLGVQRYIKLFKDIHLLKFTDSHNGKDINMYLFEFLPILKIVKEN